jgi:uncharacterized protein
MLIAIFSDLHDNINNLKLFQEKVKELNIKALIFTGDLTNNDTLESLATNYKNTIYLVSGNADLYDIELFKKYPHLKYLGEKNIININKINIGLSHFPEIAKELIYKNNDKLDFVFYGHTHRPDLEKINNCYLINPGNLNDTISPTFAVLNTKNKYIQLKNLYE